jgi:hypothetical protein
LTPIKHIQPQLDKEKNYKRVKKKYEKKFDPNQTRPTPIGQEKIVKKCEKKF